MPYERLSAQDSMFLHIEQERQPQHVGSLGILEGEPFFDEQGRFRVDAVRELIGSRLHLVPRFRRRLMTVTQYVTDLCLNEIERRGQLQRQERAEDR